MNDISKESKAFLSILIREVQDILKSDKGCIDKITEIEKLFDSWIKANNLYPEEVKVSTEFGIYVVMNEV